jgi:NAD+ diphosphatase
VNFISDSIPSGSGREPAYWFIFQEDRLLMWPAGGETAAVPRVAAVSELGVAPLRSLYLGRLHDDDGRPGDCYCTEIAADAPLPQGVIAEGLRQAYPRLGDVLFAIAGRAVQIVAWDRTNRFCGQCGAPTETLPHERAKRCPQCGLVSYPRISPAIIIAVVRRTEQETCILLARNHRFPTGRYSVIAGYVEPGESLEECARREVAEEVSIQIEEIRYFDSQPWPFPNSLMIGFTAEYAGGEIALEEGELADARWFAAGALPDLPPKMTIARRLIDWFLAANETA